MDVVKGCFMTKSDALTMKYQSFNVTRSVRLSINIHR